MKELIAVVAHYLGYLGILVCLGSAAARLVGRFSFGGFEALTLFQIGIGLIVTACFIKLTALTRGR